jgi:hypothetical protein
MSRGRTLSLVIAVVVIVGGFVIGRSLHSSPAATYEYAANVPAYAPAPSLVSTSAAGFSGYGEGGAFDGEAVVAGRVVEQAPGLITLEGADGNRNTVRVAESTVVSRIESAGADALRPGAGVIVREDGDGRVAAVLIVAEP